MGKVREIWAPQNEAIFTIYYAHITILGIPISPPMKTRNVFKKDNGREIYVLLYNVSNTVIYQLEH